MITLELTQVDHLTGRDADKIFLVGDRFAVSERTMRWGDTERTVTVVNDGLSRHDGHFVAEEYCYVKSRIRSKLRQANALAEQLIYGDKEAS